MRLRHGAASHVGLVRQQNEDSFVAGGGVFAVCDGMGGARAGEVASEVACRYPHGDRAGGGLGSLGGHRGRSQPGYLPEERGGLVLGGDGDHTHGAVATQDGVLVAHVGDSRAYLCGKAGCAS